MSVLIKEFYYLTISIFNGVSNGLLNNRELESSKLSYANSLVLTALLLIRGAYR
jgi:hypothetical protein